MQSIGYKWKRDNVGENMSALEDVLTETIEEILRLQTEIVSKHYGGENFGNSINILFRRGKIRAAFLTLKKVWCSRS